MQTVQSMRYGSRFFSVLGKHVEVGGKWVPTPGEGGGGAAAAEVDVAEPSDPEKPGAGATNVAGASEKPKGPFPGTPEKPGPAPAALPPTKVSFPKTPEAVIAQYGRATSFEALAKLPDKTDPVDLEERPKAVARPKDFKTMRLETGDRAICYGDAKDALVDKYGKVRGEKTYENVFVNASGSFGWTAANDVPREKLKMLQDMGMPRPRDLRDVSHRKLWVDWMKHTEGGKKKVV